MSKKVILTGIQPTGMPHLGNYVGAIKPALGLTSLYESRYFIADYHSLNAMKDPELLRTFTHEVAASWLACGLDPANTLIYRQSDVPETFELATIIMAFTSKGLLNRAHAYKARVEENREDGNPEDYGINMGLYTYPVLMAADILLFDADYVPVGKDQVQHIEMTVDIAQAVNRSYKKDLFTLPEPMVSQAAQMLAGLDGRKMSKSYGNAIPLFCPEKQLKKLCSRIVTNSQTVEEPKDPENCLVFALYKLFADEEERKALAERYRAGGMGWGQAKAELFRVLNKNLSPMRENYNQLMEDRTRIDRVLKEGALKARKLASRKIAMLREALGFDG